ncbi:unnamed protein product [Fusarium graminearum]|uniref:Uncharacterized protein n=1 Tax=Gibberella zeae (strain ATCC MYA-4620 / CBS 123657 / FGSC 9075 / NRRL 31084 / PH-1) TaxID=229533 RepID=I1REP1_GIBZE|nr:hypothetical protein FGSG_02135 [Fusarium graminearum PH-1]ESU07530.1 hypothetical protein FGSG_02135 [Fusarium graminearum PH-1]EYB25994.1 hypothetical protein FG05_02135 [Fusarium graminearum]CZS77645.1 unnamed protein product [Fusarium graminearum]|eukprot:XP_011318015.1 hypothetical protein FGSG_02135 [Fusarium graminearum PH-1]
MSVYQLMFVFGKSGSYLLDHPKKCTRRNMPQALIRSINKNPVQEVQSLALDANDNYFLRWTDESDSSWYSYIGLKTHYPALVEFFDEHDEHTSTVTFGPTIGDFFVFNQKTWQYEGRGLNLPDWLSDDNRQIKQVALGMNGAHCILFTNGEWTVACENNYPELYDILNDHERGDVVFVAMNPNRKNEFFLALADNTIHVQASAICEADIVDVLSAYEELEIITSHVSNFSHNLTEKPKLPQSARKGAFLKGIATSVGKGVLSIHEIDGDSAMTDIEVFTFDSESAGKTFVVDFDVVDASWLLGTKRGIHIEGYDEVVVLLEFRLH